MSTRLTELPFSQVNEIDKQLHGRLTADDGIKLLRHPKLFGAMVEAMRGHWLYRFYHGRFRPLEDKLELVREWPGVTDEMIDAAMEEAKDRIARFMAESPNNPLLDIVVSVYLDDVISTFEYAMQRMQEAWGDKLDLDNRAKGSMIHKSEPLVRYLENEGGRTIVPVFRNCVRIEVVDLGANFDPKKGIFAPEVRGKNSAHFAVVYAAIQDPVWVSQIDGKKVPEVEACGLELNDPYCALEWSFTVLVDYRPYWADKERKKTIYKVFVWVSQLTTRDKDKAVPVLWE